MAKDKKEEGHYKERPYDAEPEVAAPAKVANNAGSYAVPAVIPQGNNLPAELDDPSEYPPDEELFLPRIGIIQPTSDAVTQEGRTAGVLLDSLTGEEFESITGIFLGMTRSRKRFVKKELLCNGQDFKTGVGDPGGECEKCPLQKWDEDEAKAMAERKPKCQEHYDFVAVDSIEIKDGYPVGMPFIFSTHSTGLKSAKRFISAGRARQLPLYCFAVELTVRRITNDLGTFYVPIFTVKGQTPPETWKSLAGIAARLLTASKRAPVESTAANDAPAAEY